MKKALLGVGAVVAVAALFAWQQARLEEVEAELALERSLRQVDNQSPADTRQQGAAAGTAEATQAAPAPATVAGTRRAFPPAVGASERAVSPPPTARSVLPLPGHAGRHGDAEAEHPDIQSELDDWLDDSMERLHSLIDEAVDDGSLDADDAEAVSQLLLDELESTWELKLDVSEGRIGRQAAIAAFGFLKRDTSEALEAYLEPEAAQDLRQRMSSKR